MRMRRIAAATGALAMVGMVVVGTALVGTVTPAAASPEAASARAPSCSSGDLAVSFKYTGGAAGSTYGKMRMKNVSDRTCVTGGYGGISYVGHGNGTQIGAAADRTPGHLRSYALAPGDRLVSVVRMVEAGNYSRHECRPAKVDGFRVYVPNATLSKYVAYRQVGCRNSDIHLLSHQPYRRP